MNQQTHKQYDALQKPYRPSNGTEGMVFRDIYCNNCTKDINHDCSILLASLLHNIGEPEYPIEWIYDEDGCGICTAFVNK